MFKKKIMAGILTAVMAFTCFTPVSSFAADSTAESVAEETGTAAVLQSEEDRGEVPAGLKVDGTNDDNKVSPNSVTPSGAQQCGTNVTWELEDGVLTISGTGKMTDFEDEEDSPWYDISETITEVVVEDGVTRIGDLAFVEAYNLKKVTLADSVEELGYASFAYCESLSDFTGNGLTYIEGYAFNWTALEEFTVPKSMKEIIWFAFMGSPIKSFTVENGNTVYSAKDGVLYMDNGTTLFMYPAASERTSFTIPSTVKKVGDGAFAFASDLSEIVIPESVTALGEAAFEYCESLEEITIPDSVTEAGYFTFYECESLKSVSFGKGLKETSYEMFEECSALENIDFGTGLNSLDARTFAYCDSLESVVIPKTIKTIGNGAFGECTNLKSVTLEGG